MRVLITGNMGYVGPVVAAHLRRRYPEAELIGYDSGLFGSCLTTNGRAPETTLTAQYFGDVRDLSAGLLRGVDAVVHLAAVSNDPIGNRFEAVTDEINRAQACVLPRLPPPPACAPSYSRQAAACMAPPKAWLGARPTRSTR